MTSTSTASTCSAPNVVMDFDPAGNVHACCVNATYPLGNVRHSSIREIWEGERAQTLRAALARHDLSYGCGVCRHRLTFDAGDPASWYYQRYEAAADDAEWPFLMAFALHNTCNAACIMCGGDLSSRIRSRREGRPPLEPVYGDSFFAELREFLPHLGVTEYRGGEPFLVREHFRIWRDLIDLDHRIPCNVTTNGSIYTAEVEEIMAELPFSVMVSIDGSTRETLESIRVGVSWTRLMENIPRFQRYCDERGTTFELSCCALQQNWWEIPDVFRFASSLGARLSMQPVLDKRYGLHRLPTPDLGHVLRQLGSSSNRLSEELDEENLKTWLDFLSWLRQELDLRAAGEPVRIFEFPDPENTHHIATIRRRAAAIGGAPERVDPSSPERATPVPVELRRRRPWRRLASRSSVVPSTTTETAPEPDQALATARAEIRRWAGSRGVGEIITDDDVVVSADVDLLGEILSSVPDTLGLEFEDALSALASGLGRHVWVCDEVQTEQRVDQTLLFGHHPYREKAGAVMKLTSVGDPAHPGRVVTLVGIDPVFIEATAPT